MGKLVYINGQPVAVGTASAFYKLAAAFKKATGYNLLVTSGYRTYAQQKSLYDRWRAGTFHAPTVAKPGTSRHENGRALDLRDSGNSPGVTVAGNKRSNWMRNNSRKYGFVANGYGFREPWHFEYQGDPWKGTASASTGSSRVSKVKAIQKAVRAVQDGSAGPDTKKRVNAVRVSSAWGGRKFPHGVKYTQRVVGTSADGSWGPKSIRAHDVTVIAIQKAVGVRADGIWGPTTDRAVRNIVG